MQGTILLLDGVSTNRIILKVLLSSAFYHVVQADCLAALDGLVQRVKPDVVVTAMSLPDGTAVDVAQKIRTNRDTASTPILAIASENNEAARLAALSEGVDDVLTHPVKDMLLQARLRCLLRSRIDQHALEPSAMTLSGVAESATEYVAPAHIALVTQTPARALHWRMRLANHLPFRLTTCQFSDISNVMTASPDAVVIEIANAQGPRLAAELSARNRLQGTVILGVETAHDPNLVADALDRGADDVMHGGFQPRELAVRLKSQLRKKASAAELKASVKQDLRAAMVDPLTGLYNRRYAVPHLGRMVREAELQRLSYAIMLADLDHFKRINDIHGHVAGDTILVETARRLSEPLDTSDLVARIGGEEFLIAVPHTPKPLALSLADEIRSQINSRPFFVKPGSAPLPLTISIGLLCGPVPGLADLTDQEIARHLMDRADRALYAAKHRGRNRVSLVRDAA